MIKANVNLHSHLRCVNLWPVQKATHQHTIPKQARSRLTLHRLLSAAEALMAQGGLEAATVPAIAAAAGVSVGVVYKRFPDKDNLIRAVYERFFWTLSERNRMQLEAVVRLNLTLPDLARALIAGMVEGYRAKRGLLRALLRYAQTHPDRAFRRAAEKLNRSAISAIAALMLSHRDEIDHPDPEAAIEFALLAIGSVLRTSLLDEERYEFRQKVDLTAELTRLFFRYLGIKETSPGRSSKAR